MVSFLIAISITLHPFHVSVTDIKYKQEKKAIQISSRIFLDDLELALQEYSGNNKLDIMEPNNWEFINDNLKQYLLSKIELRDEKNRKYELNYIGAEIEEDVMWCYMEVEKVRKIESVTVKNSILFEVWSDQENLVHFRAFETVKSARLYKGNESQLFDWQ